MKRKVLVDPIHGFEWCIQVGGLKDTATTWYTKKHHLPSVDKDLHQYMGCFVYNNFVPYTGLIWIQEKTTVEMICHEVSHAVMQVCRVLGYDPRDVDEFQADYHGYLSREVSQLCNIN